MLILQINKKGYFMSKLLSGADFDIFLLIQASLATDVSWQIDGRKNEAFISAAGAEESETAAEEAAASDDYISWGDIRERLRSLIRGRTTPSFIRFQLMLRSGAVSEMKLPSGCRYLLRIDFDGTDLRAMVMAEPVLSGTAFLSPDERKEYSALWDSKALGFLTELGIDITEL